MNTLIAQLKHEYPELQFIPGEAFAWSPQHHSITYVEHSGERGKWSLLHELGHALLEHSMFTTDVQLVQLEAAAWHKATELAKTYSLSIDPNHIQDCLDTYRDWLHQRSTCPACQAICLQQNPTTYRCHNCHTTWHVTRSRLCRPYRRVASTS